MATHSRITKYEPDAGPGGEDLITVQLLYVPGWFSNWFLRAKPTMSTRQYFDSDTWWCSLATGKHLGTLGDSWMVDLVSQWKTEQWKEANSQVIH